MRIKLTLEIDGRGVRPFWWIRWIWWPRQGGQLKTWAWRKVHAWNVKHGHEVCEGTATRECIIPTWGEPYCQPHWDGELN